MKMETVREIRKQLKRWRKQTMEEEDLTAAEFAARTGLGLNTIKALLKGRSDKFNPTLDTLDKYLSVCGKNLADLFDFQMARNDDEQRLLRIAKNDPGLKVWYEVLIRNAREVDRAI